MAFRETNACIVTHQIAVEVARSREPQGALQQDLPRCRLEQIASTHDFGNAHCRIVYDTGELIAGQAILAPNQEIAKIRIRIATGDKTLWPGMRVEEAKSFAVGHAKAVVGVRCKCCCRR